MLTHLSVWLIWQQIWWAHERWLVQFKRQGQAGEGGEEWKWRGRQGCRVRVEGPKKGKWIPDGLFLVLTEGLARATRPYCSSDTPSSPGSLWWGLSVSQHAVASFCDGLLHSTKLLLVINGAFTLHCWLGVKRRTSSLWRVKRKAIYYCRRSAPFVGWAKAERCAVISQAARWQRRSTLTSPQSLSTAQFGNYTCQTHIFLHFCLFIVIFERAVTQSV